VQVDAIDTRECRGGADVPVGAGEELVERGCRSILTGSTVAATTTYERFLTIESRIL
jgi:hypothetical protein